MSALHNAAFTSCSSSTSEKRVSQQQNALGATPSPRLNGRCALITGASGGIAAATARRFAREGARVALSDLHPGGAEAVARQIRDEGGQASVIKADVTDGASVDAMAKSAAEAMGGLDVLVTCAGGYTAYARFEEIDESDWDRVIALNLKSVYLCCKAVLPYMRERGFGRIVNLGPLAGRSTSAGTSPAHYGTAKAAVSMLTQYVAKDVAQFGITANTVAPGTTATDRVEKLLTEEKRKAFVQATPVGALAQPDDIVGIITFLASEESRYITGATIDVNGGRLMLV
jgi:NAD(P)-dependent dehydrogenase (short-subunit alcohol dehydrogenase family)